jgi:hypothetical protein
MAYPTPSYELKFETRPSYLYAHIKAGTITEEMAARYLHEVANKCRELACTRLLLHRDIPATLPPGISFFIAKDFVEMTGSIRMAVVNPYVSNKEAIHFAVTWDTNRDAGYAVFDDDDDAEAWRRT